MAALSMVCFMYHRALGESELESTGQKYIGHPPRPCQMLSIPN